MAHQSTFPVRSDELLRLSEERGMSLDALASKAEIHIRSLNRILKGGRARLETVALLAKAVGTTPNNLRADIPKAELIPAKPATFTLSHTISGVMDSLAKIRHLLTISPAVQTLLDEVGINVDSFSSMLTVQDHSGDSKRTIVMINGVMNTGTKFFVIAAVRPSRYELFHQTFRFGLLNIREFDKYGEVIVCGDGDEPPDGVWEKVAEMYQTDATTLLATMVTNPPPEPDA